MKIAVFYNVSFGGAKRVVLEHVKGLKQKGHTIDVYTLEKETDAFDPSPFCHATYYYKLNPISQFPILKRFINDYTNFFSLKKLHKKIASEIDSRNYDVVLVHPDKLTQSPFVLRFLKTPSVYYCQEPLRIAYEYSFRFQEKVSFFKRMYEEITRAYRKKIDRENVRAASATIASCYHIRERMIEAYEVYPKVVYCAVNETVFHPMKIKKRNQVLYIGSPTVSVDGYDLVEQALQIIPSRIRPKLHHVTWKKENGERLTEKELVKMYNESLATICTSRLETFGLVPLESMACGTPVIATKVSGHRETIGDGKTGFLVDFEPKEIAEKIMFFIQNQKQMIAMGKNAREHIETSWTWKKCVDDLEQVLLNHITPSLSF